MMFDSEKFERLSILSKQFNQECDALNSTIEEWNKRLEALSLGQEVWLILESEEYYTDSENEDYEGQIKHQDEVYLGYAKVDNRWQLAVKEESYTQEKNTRGFDT